MIYVVERSSLGLTIRESKLFSKIHKTLGVLVQGCQKTNNKNNDGIIYKLICVNDNPIIGIDI